jgi:hypothetical protein
MKSALLLLCAGFFLAGCATHSDEQIASVRAAGVSPRTVAKLQRDDVLAPEDLIELRQHRVADSVPVRHLREVGVDYIAQRNDLRRLRAAGVRPIVVDELIFASQRFVRDRHDDRPRFAWGVTMPYDPWYGHYGPHPYDYGWPYY